MAFLDKVGDVVAVIGLLGMFWLSDLLSGYTKAERMGRVRYSDTSKKRKKKWSLFLISLGILGVGMLLKWLGGGFK